MRQIVLLKDIPNLTDIKIDSKTRKPIITGVKKKISEVDKRALETAIKLKESIGGEIFTLSMGDEKTKTAMLEALAMGADAAYIINEPKLKFIDTNATSKVLETGLKKIGGFDLILAGEMTLDSLSSQIGPRLAELLDLPLITYVRELESKENKIIAIRDLEDVDEVVETEMPCIVTVVREINEPRIPNLMNIMRAKKKPQTIWTAKDLGLNIAKVRNMSHVQIIDIAAPEVKRKKIRINADSVEETALQLVEALVKEGVLGR
jgi:electron transfer flavoprotein beta subunit